ncbi:MAG: ThiF family adenylyltransferase [Acidobacteriota bacterium]|nr:MAG: ThiF family adenylyltransferase [Acidobacteriota bacterium]
METFTRQQDLLTPEHFRGHDIDVVGAGSLGGAIVMTLCKMGAGIRNCVTVTDFDACAPHNLPTQWFRAAHADLGEAKVTALEEMVGFVCERPIRPIHERFTGSEPRPVGPVLIVAVDTLEERRRIWATVRDREEIQLLIDPRMGAEVLEIYTLSKKRGGYESHDSYEHSLDDGGEPFRERCTRRSILYTALGAAAFVGSLVAAHVSGRELPRHLVFDFRNFLLQVQQ